MFVIFQPHRSWPALKPTFREPNKTAPTSVAQSRRSLHKPQYCAKGSTQGYGGLVLSRQNIHRMEVYRIPLVGLRKTCVPVAIGLARAFSQTRNLAAGSGKSVFWYVVSGLLLVWTLNSSFASSSVIQDIMAVCEAGSAIMAYFYFDFRDLDKQTCRHLLLSLVSQLSTRSSSCCDILHRIYKTHENGTRQPSDDTLKECLEKMLRLPGQGPIFIILDALDECPDSSGIPSPRDEVLQLVKALVDLDLQQLHICATSRPEVDIRVVLEPLALRSISLHDESGQKTDIEDYVRNVVNSSQSMAMRRWRDDDKNLVIETLTERSDGM